MNKLVSDGFLENLRLRLAAEEQLMKQGILKDEGTGREYFSGYSYKVLYDWDQYFESLVQIYMGWPSEYIKNGVLIFLDNQRESGLISRSVPSNEYHDPEHVKPFLAQVALLVKKAYGETDWLLNERYFPRLKRYLDYWLIDMDENRNGLSEWMSAPHTGMDNQIERAGFWLDRFCEGVDLNSYLVRETRAFAELARDFGKTELAADYSQKAEALAERIREKLWDEADGFFYDGNARFGEALMSRHAGRWTPINNSPGPLIRIKSVSSFAALWAGVAASEQARRMVSEHLFNPREFWVKYPIPALAKSERWYSSDFFPMDLGCNWRAKTWIPTNYMVYHGLKNYGYKELASQLAERTLELMRKAGNREYYDTETGNGDGLDPFWGWSLIAHFLPYEEQAAETLVRC
jgi:glycogen debranching enzyme